MHTGGDFWHYGGLMRSLSIAACPSMLFESDAVVASGNVQWAGVAEITIGLRHALGALVDVRAALAQQLDRLHVLELDGHQQRRDAVHVCRVIKPALRVE